MSYGRRRPGCPSTYTAPLPTSFQLTPAQSAFESELNAYKAQDLNLGYEVSSHEHKRQSHIVPVNMRFSDGVERDGMTYKKDKLWEDHVRELSRCLWNSLEVAADRTGGKGH